MSENQEIALSIFMKHVDQAMINGSVFRKIVLEELKVVLKCSQQSAAVRYNDAKKYVERTSPHLIVGLGRNAVQPQQRSDIDPSMLSGMAYTAPSARTGNASWHDLEDEDEDLIDFDDIYVVFAFDPIRSAPIYHERQYEYQGEASEDFDLWVETFPKRHWVMMKGQPPMSMANCTAMHRQTFIKEHVPVGVQDVPKNKTYNIFVEDDLYEVVSISLDEAIKTLRIKHPSASVIEEATPEELAELIKP